MFYVSESPSIKYKKNFYMNLNFFCLKVSLILTDGHDLIDLELLKDSVKYLTRIFILLQRFDIKSSFQFIFYFIYNEC